MVDLIWKLETPEISDLGGHSEEYFWVRGWNFNRPTIVRANSGVNSKLVDGVREYKAEVNFMFGEGYPQTIWASDLCDYHGRLPLEWAGPVPRPIS